MNYYLLFISVMLIFNRPIHGQDAKRYKLDITINGEIRGGKVFLRYWGEKGPFLDSTNFSNGKAMMTGTVPEKLTIAKIYLKTGADSKEDNENSCEVFLEAAIINIIASQKLQNAFYSGTTLQEQFSELYHELIPVKRRNLELDDAYTKAEEKNDYGLRDKLLTVEYPLVFKEKQKILEAFIRKYPASLISAKKFEEFAGDGNINLEVVEPVYELLDRDLKEIATVEAVANRIAITKKTAPGMKAPEFSQADTSGKDVNLYSFRGKYLLIDFWAGWCVPCRAENPLLRKLYNQYNEKGFEILGVSLDGEREAWTKAIQKDKLIWVQVSDLQIFDNAVAKLYGVVSIPQNILIGPEGEIIAWNMRGSVLEDRLKKLFD